MPPVHSLPKGHLTVYSVAAHHWRITWQKMTLVACLLQVVAPPILLLSIPAWAKSARCPSRNDWWWNPFPPSSTSISGSLYTMQLNGPFTLFMIPALISDGAFNLKRYYATKAIRSRTLMQDNPFSFKWLPGDAGEANCYVSGYFLTL